MSLISKPITWPDPFCHCTPRDKKGDCPARATGTCMTQRPFPGDLDRWHRELYKDVK